MATRENRPDYAEGPDPYVTVRRIERRGPC